LFLTEYCHCGFFAPIFLELDFINLQKVTDVKCYIPRFLIILTHGLGKDCEEPEHTLCPEDAHPPNQNVSSLWSGFL